MNSGGINRPLDAELRRIDLVAKKTGEDARNIDGIVTKIDAVARCYGLKLNKVGLAAPNIQEVARKIQGVVQKADGVAPNDPLVVPKPPEAAPKYRFDSR